MAFYSLDEIVQHARNNSQFFRALYLKVPEKGIKITDVPILNQKAYWDANTVGETNSVLTGAIKDGIVFKSGGTTGNPKFSVFSSEEWGEFTQSFGQGLIKGGLRSEEKVANLFASGELYASLLFISRSIEAAGQGVNYPISFATNPDEIVEIIELFNIETLAGLPITIMKLADCVVNGGHKLSSVKRIIFGGESMYPDQREVVSHAFPGVRIQSIGYASVDGGELGYADSGCKPGEHRVFSQSTILEIVDEETGAVIEDCDTRGKILITNLTRILMPIIRYPAGDRACWVEPPGTPDRKFELIGRSEEGARIGPMTLYIQDILDVISSFRDQITISNFQIQIVHEAMKDRGVLRLVPEDANKATDQLAKSIIEKVYKERPMFKDLLKDELVHPLRVAWISTAELIVNRRTGKLRRILDDRE